MRILLTNDDGIESIGITLLRDRLSEEHEVWMVAPDGERSGCSHSITLREPVRIRKLEERSYSCRGTPADCVLRGCLGLLPSDIDLIISGVNLGPNLGTDIIYSGTAAAARQGALMDYPAVAASLSAYRPPYELDFPIQFIARNVELFRSLWASDHFLNVNFPANSVETPHIAVTFPARRIYRDKLINFTAPVGDIYSFLGGTTPESHYEDGSDHDAIESGKVSLSPILIHPSNHRIEEKYKNATFWD